ncbi:MAG: sulfatase-like hydrolase/transferase [Immundisolibacteraceae bacterium]|nr:sulfatase-like hydrolase/transferase [Immundisolibacteraceae bacterium]
MLLTDIKSKAFQKIYFNFSLIAVLVLVALPCQMYLLNRTEIAWDGWNWLVNVLLVMIFLVGFALLIARYNKWVVPVVLFITRVVFIYIFIRAFFIPIDYGFMEGFGGIELDIVLDNDFWVSLGIIFLIAWVVFRKPDFVESILTILGVFLVCFIVYGHFEFYTSKVVENPGENGFSRFSKNDNVIVLSLDGVQNDVLIDFIKNKKDILASFSGFTAYSDVVSYAPTTNFSILSTVTGEHIVAGNSGMDFDSLMEKYSAASIAQVLGKNNYKVDVFNVPCELAADYDCDTTVSVLPSALAKKSGFTAYDISILRVLPKSLSWSLVNYLSRPEGSQLDMASKIVGDVTGGRYGMDIFSFRKMVEEIRLVEEPVFKFHHYAYSHHPIRFDENCVYQVQAFQNFESAVDEISCVLSELNQFFDKLKRLGIYEDALIVVASDHGYPDYLQPRHEDGSGYEGALVNAKGHHSWTASRYWPMLMVKLPNAKGSLGFSDRPASLVDIAPTVYDVTGLSGCKNNPCDGESLLVQRDKDSSHRRAIFYVGGKENINSRYDSTEIYSAMDIEGNYVEGVAKAIRNISLMNSSVECNEPVLFTRESGYFASGLSGVSRWGRRTAGKKTTLLFNLDDESCEDFELTLELKSFFSEQEPRHFAAVFFNDEKIGDIDIQSDEAEQPIFVFNFPPELLNRGGVNSLTLKNENVKPRKSKIGNKYFPGSSFGLVSMTIH